MEPSKFLNTFSEKGVLKNVFSARLIRLYIFHFYLFNLLVVLICFTTSTHLLVVTEGNVWVLRLNQLRTTTFKIYFLLNNTMIMTKLTLINRFHDHTVCPVFHKRGLPVQGTRGPDFSSSLHNINP